jgi:Protein of unknown function (DUF2950)
MYHDVGKRANPVVRLVLFAATLALLLAIPSCNKQDAATSPAIPKTFATPQQAGQALAIAAKSEDRDQLLRIFGSNASDIISAGDPVQDKAALNAFTQAYQTMNRWRKMTDGSQVLLIGADNFPFPIPLKKNASGQWYFDTDAGRDEILSRRIGRDELFVINVCSAFVDAQREYYSEKHGGVKQYAQKFLSDPGQQNGLYWDSPQGAPRSPLGPLAAYATNEGYKIQPGQHQPFHGYYFLMLTRQGPDAHGGAKTYIVNGKMTGGFAAVAYPAKYGDSGIMTFMVNQDGVTLQKDLGKSTEQIASAMKEFNPDKTWAPLAP